MELYHDSIPAGHPGQAGTLGLIARTYYWPRMSEYVNRYVDGCEPCQRAKPRRVCRHGRLQPLEVPSGPWQHISVDFIGPLPIQSEEEDDAILVAVDKFTKRSHVLPARTTMTAEETADLFYERIWSQHGTPLKVVLDRGPQFVACFMRRIFQRMGIKGALSTAHHPQTDGQTERVNQEVEIYLRMYVDFYQEDWKKWLPSAEFALNSRTHTAHGHSPFFVDHGYQPTFAVEHASSHLVPTADRKLDELRKVHEEVRALLELSAARMKKFHDDWVDEAPSFVPGDKVFLERPDLRSSRPSHKLDWKRFGPFEVTQKISDTAYRLKLPASMKIHDVFHVGHLIPRRKDTILGRQVLPPPPTVIDGEEEFTVERVLKSRRRAGVTEYLLRWTGYGESEDEWVPEYDMHAEEKVKEFLERQGKGKVRRKGRRKRT